MTWYIVYHGGRGLTKHLTHSKLSAMRPKVIAVVMTYNCARLLPQSYERIPKDLVDEIIVTDDGSSDGSYEVAQRLGLTAYRHTPNRGYGGNLKEGFRLALERKADYVVEVHGDGQFDPIAIRQAMPHMQQGVDFIFGSRFIDAGQALKNGMSSIRFFANRLLTIVDRLILGLPLTDYHTGFRIYSRRMLEKLSWQNHSNDYLFSFEIIVQAAYYRLKVAEVPVEANYNGEHTSISLKKSAIYAFQTFYILGQFILARFGLVHSDKYPKL